MIIPLGQPAPDHLRVVAHADWSVQARKRQLATATRQAGGAWQAAAPQPVGDCGSLITRLLHEADGGSVILALDLPLGVPLAYAQRVEAATGLGSFPALLRTLGRPPWEMFGSVAETVQQISLWRPFYPARPGNARRSQLCDALQLSPEELLRICDRGYPGRPAAAPLFWTLGAQQVGKAALHGWHALLAPALHQQLPVALWPFDGLLAELLQPGRVVIVEGYPAECARRLGIAVRGKRRQEERQRHAEQIMQIAEALTIHNAPTLEQALLAGFGPGSAGEDQFDPIIGLYGTLHALAHGDAHEPHDPQIRAWEGWIFGQPQG